MRTKHLLWTMALPALFAACSSEDVFEAGQADQLAGRKVLENITFTLGDAETRFDRGETGWSFSEEDAFGACLVDYYAEAAEAKRGAVDNYKLSSTIQTNYQYVIDKATGTWHTPALMVEGNYVFYAPYNAKHLSRKPLQIVTPVTQQLDVNEDGSVKPYSAINNVIATGNPFFISYQFLPEEGQSKNLSLTLRPIFALPEMTVENEKTEDVTIKKLIIKTNDNFVVSAPMKIGTADAVASATSTGLVGNFFNVGAEDKKNNPWGAWVKAENASGLNGATTDLQDVTDAPEANIIVVNIPGGMVVKAGQKAKFNIVLPAKKYTADTEVYAYINDSEGYKFTISNNATFFPNKRYPQEEYTNAGSLSSKAGSIMTAKIVKDMKTQEIGGAAVPVVVASTEELVKALTNGAKSFNVIPTTKDVAINADVLKAMRQVNFQGMTVKGDIKIEGGENAEGALEINEQITIDGTATVKGFVTLNQGSSATAILTATTVSVDKNADLTINKATINNLKNAGHVDVAGDSTIGSVENASTGTLDINKDLTLTTLANKGTVNMNYAGYNYTPAAVEGTWNVNANMSVQRAATVKDEATVTVVEGAVVSGATITIEGGAEVNVNGRVENTLSLAGNFVAAGSEKNKDATLNVNDGAFIKASVSGTGNASVNIMNVAKGATFFNAPTLTNMTSIYTFTGNISKAEEVPTYPAGINKVVIDGNVTVLQAYNVEPAGCDLVITGNVESKDDVTLGVAGKTVTVEGNVEIADEEVTFAGSVVTVGGTLKLANTTNSGVVATSPTSVTLNNVTIDKALTLANATTVVVKGSITAKDDLILTRAAIADFYGNILMVDTKSVVFNATAATVINIRGNVTLEGATTAGTFDLNSTTSTTVNVWGDNTLTIASRASITTNGTQTVSFDSKTLKNDGVTAATKRGQVANGGTVSKAAAAYDKSGATPALGQGWWTGTTATN